MNNAELEKYSSAVTLSDMEIFVFPELMYSLVLANIASPLLWEWRGIDCFAKLDDKSPYRRLMRLKQFIIDEYEFNLDLETWGLTTRQRELARFEGFVPPEDISESNALFGYHGDSYYFDVDIRRHFGLDKYDGDVIPYWKTETLEAMNAFRLKKGYQKAAGECVSLAALYAAAAFVVCRIPLEDIYMILTPLHSQNFIDLQDGVLTNNRRLVTKAMWFNGTEISNKAQRALRNENITIVSHCSGYVHCLYNECTMDPGRYSHFEKHLIAYLTEELSLQTFASFLRTHMGYQKHFQVCRDCHGQARFLPAEVLFHYEHGSRFRVDNGSYEKLLAEINEEDFVPYELPGRIRCDRIEAFLKTRAVDLNTQAGRAAMETFLEGAIPDAGRMVAGLADFLCTRPKLPAAGKKFLPSDPIVLDINMTRIQIVEYLKKMRATSTTADLAFYACRDMESCRWEPFVKAAIERNPVSLEKTASMDIASIVQWLDSLGNNSIYEGKRLAQPDEVVNFGTGDGLEKAFALANILVRANPDSEVTIAVNNDNALVQCNGDKRVFRSGKGLKGLVHILPGPAYSVQRD